MINALQLPQQQQRQQADLERSTQQQQEESRCLSCIRSVSSTGVDLTRRCEGYYCGPYQISYQYWAEAGKPGNSQGTRDYEKCARDKQCAESTVKAYFKKFKRDCNNDGLVDCLDMAALHKGGPQSCSLDWFYRSRYWQAFNKTTCVADRDPISLATALAAQKAGQDKKDSLGGSTNRQPQAVMKNQTLTSECLDCICEALTSCSSSQTLSASNCGSNTVCGPFAISQSYWKDGRRPGASWTACARTKECSTVTIRNYMDKHKRDCNGDGFVTCEDYAAIHRRGPKSCMNRDLMKEQFWARFLACRANQKPNNDANLVKVDEDDTQAVGYLGSRGSPSLTTTSNQVSSSPSGTSIIPITSSPNTGSGQPKPSTITHHGSSLASMSTDSMPSYPSSTSYELSSINLETKQLTDNNPIKSFSTLEPTTAKITTTISSTPTSTTRYHELPGTSAAVATDDRFTLDNSHEHNASQDTSATRGTTLSSSSSYHPGVSQTTRIINQDYPEPHRMPESPTHPARPTMDYNSLPTIIVSKPLGSSSSTRVSQPPLSPQYFTSGSQGDRHTHDQTTGGMMMTTARPPSSVPASLAATMESYSSSEPDTATTAHPTGSGNETAASGQPLPGTPDDLHSVEYGVPDFEPIGGPTVSSFDRVVNGIVGSPDFSKAQPPVPEIVQQRRQSESPAPRGPPVSSTTSISQDSPLTRARDQWASSSTPSMSSTSNKRENSKTLSPNYLTSGDNSAPSASQSDTSILTGPSALNMTSLFDKGILNETSRIPSECLDCICDASSNCDTTVQCISKQREKNRCGMYMISWNQYKESDISLTSLMPPSSPSTQQNDDQDEKLYYECSTDRNCAEKLIHLYIEKYSKDCNHDGKIDCYDIAALHRVGPDNCNSHKFLSSQYWRDFNHCYVTDRLATTTEPQLSSQGIH